MDKDIRKRKYLLKTQVGIITVFDEPSIFLNILSFIIDATVLIVSETYTGQMDFLVLWTANAHFHQNYMNLL